MTTFLLVVALILGGALAIMYFLKQRADTALASARQQRDKEVARAQSEAQAAVTNAQATYEQKIAELNAESETYSAEHYEKEATKIADEANLRLAELEPLRAYAVSRMPKRKSKRHSRMQ